MSEVEKIRAAEDLNAVTHIGGGSSNRPKLERKHEH